MGVWGGGREGGCVYGLLFALPILRMPWFAVGWVERSETHQKPPPLLQLRLRIRRIQRLHRIKRLDLRRLLVGRRRGILLLFAMQQHQHVAVRSEEHTSELQSLMRISYADFCLKKKTN